MTTPDGLPPLREVIAAAQLTARRSLGQNFILDLNLTRRIARAGGPLDGTSVVEIGAGPGGLTRALLIEDAARVVAVERDKRCLPVLEDIAAYYPQRLEIVEADALTVDYTQLVPGGETARIIANLPYGIATELLTRWLASESWPPWYDRMVLMFQREVAERIVAAPGAKAYGRLAILSQWRSEARILFNLPPQAFTPKPKVASAVVELVPRAQPENAGSPKALEAVTAAAFGQRRKMLKSSLKALGEDSAELLAETGIDPSLRAEALTVSDFCALARALYARGV